MLLLAACRAKWGDAIPHLQETTDKAHMAIAMDHPVERWMINGQVVGNRGVVNCPTVMSDPMRKYFPQYWGEVPSYVYDPTDRLSALDQDGVDGEVLFPNDPVQSGTFFQGNADFELDCVRAYNDAIAEWREVSDRYVPLAVIPYMSGIEVTVAEVQRAVNKGHRGIVMLVEPSQNLEGLKHFNDPYWDPLWATCQDLNVPVHWHAGGGLRLTMPRWSGYTRNQEQAMGPSGGFSVQAQFIPNLGIFSGVLDRYPRLRNGSVRRPVWDGVNYILEGCDHEWERRHLWTEGIVTRPSGLFRSGRSMSTSGMSQPTFSSAITLASRTSCGSPDYPHSTSTYPESWQFVNRTTGWRAGG
jgi:predicted TIM-barrel fold metal-dependent hydrolase